MLTYGDNLYFVFNGTELLHDSIFSISEARALLWCDPHATKIVDRYGKTVEKKEINGRINV